MDNPRADKVAVVDEVRERLAASDGAVLTEYRGLTVAALANLRRELATAGGDYKVYKNTLVRLAVADSPKESIRDLLTGPTAIAFVPRRALRNSWCSTNREPISAVDHRHCRDSTGFAIIRRIENVRITRFLVVRMWFIPP